MSSMTKQQIQDLDWQKAGGQIPAIVQDAVGQQVLMLGYMTAASLAATFASGFVTFFSRSRQQLWQKGETSGHKLVVQSIAFDCDRDALLVQARALGPTCHTGAVSCFGEMADGHPHGLAFLDSLSNLIDQRAEAAPGASSYTRTLLDRGILKMAQKVGEEGVEVALAAAAEDDQALLGEAADLVFHLMVLLKGRNLTLQQVVEVLAQRHAAKS